MSSSIAKGIEREQKLEKEGLNKEEDRKPDPEALGDAHKSTVNAGMLPRAAALTKAHPDRPCCSIIKVSVWYIAI